MFQKTSKNLTLKIMLWTMVIFMVTWLSLAGAAESCVNTKEYGYWKEVGSLTANQALSMICKKGVRVKAEDCMVLTSAGYAEIKDRDTAGALDGLNRVLGVKRGDHSLIEVHSAPDTALWFAVYHEKTGYCAYLQVNPGAIGSDSKMFRLDKKNLFSTKAAEKINAENLFSNAAEFAEKFNNKIFGGNEFRIVTIANAVAVGAPSCAVRAFEFHDHYCPGVTSGILMALYIKNNFAKEPAGSYFVQSVQPWCKEDALMVILNTTPGKSGYHVSYPTAGDMTSWADKVKNASTIVYRKDPVSGLWDGVVLGYQGGTTGCPSYGHSVMDKLCADLWYLKRLDHPEEFIKVLHEFELPEGVTPQSYARPGVDPMVKLGLVK